MSGLEAPAAAFALVGVTDVVVRAAFKIHRLLSDVRDAPREIQELRECINETSILAQAAKTVLDELNDPTPSVTSPAAQLINARRALERELKDLNTRFARYKGSSNRWSSIRHVLDERKVTKTLGNIERSKTLLCAALALANRHLSKYGHENIEKLVQRCYEETFKALDANCLQTTAKLNDIDHLTSGAQKEMKSSQEDTLNALDKQYAETQEIRRDISNSEQTSTQEHQTTRNLVKSIRSDIFNDFEARMNEIHQLMTTRSQHVAVSTRQIRFFGERRDMILAYLLSLKDGLEIALDNVLMHNTDIINPKHVTWLRSEYQNLLASAAQEEASQYVGSTATSMACWTFPSLVNQNPDQKLFPYSHPPILFDTPSASSHLSSKCRHWKTYVLTHTVVIVESPLGIFQFTFPKRSHEATEVTSDFEAGVHYLPGHNQHLTSLCIAFARCSTERLQPKFYAQLNAFTLAPDKNEYRRLMKHKSIQEIDAAFRTGVISPYWVDEAGHNLALYYAARARRPNVLKYLDSQGIGILNFHDSTSVLAGCIYDITFHSGIELDTFSEILDYIHNALPALPAMLVTELSCLLFRSFLWDNVGNTEHHFRLMELLMKRWMNHLEWLSPSSDHKSAHYTCQVEKDTPEQLQDRVNLLRTVLRMGADINALEGVNALSLALTSSCYENRLEEILCVLIEAGADLHGIGILSAGSPSRTAYWYDRWPEWCGALERTGKRIEDVLEAEGLTFEDLEEDYMPLSSVSADGSI